MTFKDPEHYPELGLGKELDRDKECPDQVVFPWPGVNSL